MRNTLWISLILASILLLTACAAPPQTPAEAPEESPPVTEPEPAQDVSYTTPPFAFPISGGYHEALATEQGALREKGLLFGLLIDTQQDWEAAIEKYKFESAREGQTLDYNTAYFEKYALLLVFADQGSSSVQYQFGKAEATDYLLDVTLEQYLPEMGTTDIVMKGFVAGLEKSNLYLNDGSKKPLNITQRTVPAVTDTPRNELTIEDLRLGNLSLRLAALELDFRMARLPESVVKDDQNFIENRAYGDVDIMIVENEVFKISTESPNYPTPRGLKVGDSIEQLKALYGEPSDIQKADLGNDIYSYDLSGEFFLFHAEIKDGTVIRLQVNLNI